MRHDHSAAAVAVQAQRIHGITAAEHVGIGLNYCLSKLLQTSPKGAAQSANHGMHLSQINIIPPELFLILRILTLQNIRPVANQDMFPIYFQSPCRK